MKAYLQLHVVDSTFPVALLPKYYVSLYCCRASRSLGMQQLALSRPPLAHQFYNAAGVQRCFVFLGSELQYQLFLVIPLI